MITTNCPIQFSYTSIAADEFDSLLANAFDCKTDDKLVPISPDKGEGTLFIKEIDKDLFLLSLDILLKKDFICNKQVIFQEKLQKSFTISYLLNADTFKLENTISKEQIYLKRKGDIILATD
ncbi:MAG: hypothetical protein ABIN36_04570 [Ferruginibacter sp.]